MSPGGLDGSREVIFTGISKLTVLLYTCCFSCQNFSLLVPSNVRVRKNFPYPSPAPPEESGLAGLVLWFPIANIQHGGVGASSL